MPVVAASTAVAKTSLYLTDSDKAVTTVSCVASNVQRASHFVPPRPPLVACFETPSNSPMIVTPTSHEGGINTPPTSNIRQRGHDDHVNHCNFRIEDENEAVQALEVMLQGIQTIKTMLERPLDQACHPNTDFDDQDQTVQDLSLRLIGVLGSNLLGLWNAAKMARNHARLQNEENASLLQDLRHSKKLCIEACRQVEETDRVNRRLYREKQQVMKHVHKLRTDRRALIRECKSLRREMAHTRKFDSWRLLEEHVLDSVDIHEIILKKASAASDHTIECKKKEEPVEQIVEVSCQIEEDCDPVGMNGVVDAVLLNDPDPFTSIENDESNLTQTVLETTSSHKPISNVPAAKVLGFFSRFSMSLHEPEKMEHDVMAVSTSIGPEKRKKGEKMDDCTVTSRDQISCECQEGSSSSQSNDQIMVVSDDLALVEDDEQAQRAESTQQCNGMSRRNGGFGRFWNSNHFLKDCDNDTETTTVSNHLERGEDSTADRSDPKKHANSVDSASINEAPFVFDKTYRLAIPTKTHPSVDEDSPGDEDRTRCTESSHSGTGESDPVVLARELPRSVSFRSQKEGSQHSECSSPLMTPTASPPGHPTPKIKPLCDPNILRTLAIPGSDPSPT